MKAAISNKQRKLLHRRIQAEPRQSNTHAGPVATTLIEAPPMVDGLRLLDAKGKLAGLKRIAYDYRRAYILAGAEGVPVRSCLNMEPGGSEAKMGQPPIVAETEAKQLLFRYRWAACAGLPELRHVLDEVCGRGRSIWDLAGGKQLVAVKLEANLLTALRLIAQHLDKKLDSLNRRTEAAA